ncbi:Rieske 2Fe-2S domain-containing protein [Streptomyces avidinii]
MGPVRDLRPGEGTVVRAGGKPCAVHRDDQGELHALSAVCTHLDASWPSTTPNARGSARATAFASALTVKSSGRPGTAPSGTAGLPELT